MKKYFSLLLLTLVFLFPFQTVQADNSVKSTNLNGISFHKEFMDTNNNIFEPTRVLFPYGSENIIGTYADYQGLFINGSFIKDSKLLLRENRLLAPTRLLANNLGFTVNWKEKTKEAHISNSKTSLLLKEGSKKAIIDNKEIEDRELMDNRISFILSLL